jgi:hypothetical protein
MKFVDPLSPAIDLTSGTGPELLCGSDVILLALAF